MGDLHNGKVSLYLGIEWLFFIFVLYAIVHCIIYHLLVWVKQRIDNIRRSFLWKGKKEVFSCACLVNWKTVCKSEEQDNLELLNCWMNDALLSLTIQCFWVQLVKYQYHKQNIIGVHLNTNIYCFIYQLITIYITYIVSDFETLNKRHTNIVDTVHLANIADFDIINDRPIPILILMHYTLLYISLLEWNIPDQKFSFKGRLFLLVRQVWTQQVLYS